MAQIIQKGRDKFQIVIDYRGVRKKHTLIGTKAQATQWGRDREAEIDQGGNIKAAPVGTIGELVEAYEREMEPIKKWSHTKSYNLFKVRKEIGHVVLASFDKQTAIDYGKRLAKTRGPNGVKERLNYLGKALGWGFNHKDYPLAPQIEALSKAMKVMGDLKVVGEAQARTRNPSDAEIDKLIATAEKMSRGGIDMPAILNVLRVLPLRVGELCQIEWTKLDPRERSVKLKRKHPTDPDFVQEVALPVIGGVDTYELIAGRDRSLPRPFPYSSKTVSTYFWLLHKMAGIEDIHLHDFRAHAITWLRLNGLDKMQAKALMGHSKDSKVLDEIYTRVKPRDVHAAITEAGIDTKARRKTGQVVPLREAA
jgi:integrase